MKTLSFVLLSYLASTAHPAVASPAPQQLVLNTPFDTKLPFGGPGRWQQQLDKSEKLAEEILNDAKKAILKGKKNLDTWWHQGREYIKENGLLYELVSSKPFANYQLRVTEPQLCDPAVKQYSGYLDVAEDKHLFFWFFEARNKPKDAPVILWLNGGPGCSSSTGLLFELGPCSITNEGHNTTRNPHSWNNDFNIIFLDQPVNVGYSYADNGGSVNTSPVAGVDVHAFLQLFYKRFPEYASAPFHLAAESYGGTYAPNFASVIHRENKKIALAPVPGVRPINLASVILANGLTDPYIQMASIPDYVCNGPYPVYEPDSVQCQAMRTKVPTCQRLIKACYDYESRLACVPAQLYCNTQLMGPLVQTGLNPYDVRRKCDRQKDKDGPLCYRQMGWIEVWMNDPKNKAALGVPPAMNFESCNMEVNQAFTMAGDGMHNSAKLLTELVNEGVRLLVYAGNADMMCNYLGNERWVDSLDSVYGGEFKRKKATPWVIADSNRQAGEVRRAGPGAGNVTFVNIYEAGHMVPYDQPEAALDLINKWVLNTPI